jgi:hypothetical protein
MEAGTVALDIISKSISAGHWSRVMVVFGVLGLGTDAEAIAPEFRLSLEMGRGCLPQGWSDAMDDGIGGNQVA